MIEIHSKYVELILIARELELTLTMCVFIINDIWKIFTVTL